MTGGSWASEAGLPNAERSARMRRILRQELVPTLRELGFRGCMPHLHRQREKRLDLLNVQFSYNGQYFFVNLGRIELARDRAGSAAKPAKKQLNVNSCPLEQRARLTIGSLPQRLRGGASPGFEMWDFTAQSDAEADDLMHRLADRLREFLRIYAEPWWRAERLREDLPRPVGPGLAPLD